MIYPAGWFLISLLTLSNVADPEVGHIQWQFSSLQQSSTEWELAFTAKIDRGWHLYSQSIEEGGPMPTSFEFDEGDGFELLGNVTEAGEAKQVFDSIFVMNVVWYETEVVFTQRVKAKSDVSVSGKVSYSVCSEERCIPGSTRFAISLKKK